MALGAGFDPSRIYMHGNNKSAAELKMAFEAGIGCIVVDSLEEISRADWLAERDQDVLVRLTPGISPSTHSYIQTGQIDSKFGFAIEGGQADAAVAAVAASRHLELAGFHAHLGSQIYELDSYVRAIELMAEFCAAAFAADHERGRRPRDRLLADRPAALDRGLRRPQGRRARALLRPAAEDPARARALAGRQRRRDHLHGRRGQGDPGRPHLRRRRRRHVRQPAADALRVRVRGADRQPRRRGGDRDSAPSPASIASPATSSSATSPSPIPAPATCSSPRRPAPTATRWPTTTTASRGRRSSSAATVAPPSRSAARPMGTWCRAMSEGRVTRIGLLGRGTVGGAFHELLAEPGRRGRGGVGHPPGDQRRPPPQRGRLRVDPRGLRPDRRADRRHRSRPRLRAARASRRQAGGDREQAARRAVRRRALRGRPRRPESRSATRPPSPARFR